MHITRVGYMSGAMNYFIDRVYYDSEGKIDGKLYALFVRAGSDGSGAIFNVQRILSRLAVREVQEPLIIVGELGESRVDQCEVLGLTLTAGLWIEMICSLAGRQSIATGEMYLTACCRKRVPSLRRAARSRVPAPSRACVFSRRNPRPALVPLTSPRSA